jgi:hypothetical protein
MFSSIFDDPKNEFLRDRLARLSDEISRLELSTREEFLAEIYSRVNRVLAMGTAMQPLVPVTAEGPAKIGDLVDNFTRLNQDGSDIAGHLLRMEDVAASLYNLAATTQNNIRQTVRSRAFASDELRYIEGFVNLNNLEAGASEMVDVNAGIATLPLVQENKLEPVISIGDNSIGEEVVGVDALTDDRIETALQWKGTKLELILTFPKAEIVNRIKLEMDDYQGLEITEFTTSPDGSLVEDVLADVGERSIHLNGISSKYSGDAILDFNPRHCKVLRLVLEDRVDIENIALRSLSVFSRRYQSTGTLASAKINAPSGTILFTTEQLTKSPLTSISHQISYNGVNYSAIVPGSTIPLTSVPFWYRAIFERYSSRFEDASTPVAPTNADPLSNPSYVMVTSNSIPLGGGILERTLHFQTIDGPVPFRESPLPGTLKIQEGSVLLGDNDYAFNNNVLSFADPRGNITVTYQTSSLGQAAISERREFYTPLLKQVVFKKV